MTRRRKPFLVSVYAVVPLDRRRALTIGRFPGASGPKIAVELRSISPAGDIATAGTRILTCQANLAPALADAIRAAGSSDGEAVNEN